LKLITRIISLGSSLLGPQHRKYSPKETPLKFGWNRGGVALLRKPAISLKRGKIGPRLLLMTNRKLHTRFRLLPKSTTLNDLEWPPRKIEWIKIDSNFIRVKGQRYYIVWLTPSSPFHWPQNMLPWMNLNDHFTLSSAFQAQNLLIYLYGQRHHLYSEGVDTFSEGHMYRCRKFLQSYSKS